jgi:hypothetical protein
MAEAGVAPVASSAHVATSARRNDLGWFMKDTNA